MAKNSPFHMEAVCDFCQFEVGEKFESQMEAEEDPDTVLKILTSEYFAEYFEKYRAEKAKTIPEWRTVTSPYAI